MSSSLHGKNDFRDKYWQPTTTAPPSPDFEQQHFLNTTIKDWTCSAGFGESSSTLGVNLVPDEFYEHKDPVTGETLIGDNFDPPDPGAPLFFLFGNTQSNIATSYISTFNDIYGFNENGDQNNFFQSGGNNHFVFGGILQAINESKDLSGNPAISCSLTDPREILANVSLILNNYAGTTFNSDNLFNIFGFLEFNTPDSFNPLGFGTFSGLTSANFFPAGNDMYSSAVLNVQESLEFGGGVQAFPITGTGFSRRCPQGIPYFRVAQALNALMGFYGDLPQLYEDAGFGGFVKFRGYNYIVDLSGLPTLDPLYFLNYDQISLLDLCLEICEVSNTELFVSLLPITNHPAAQFLYDRFGDGTAEGAELNGIIRVDAVDRSKAQGADAIKNYLDGLPTGTNITQKSFGTELSNVTTDKFIAGANEVEMYYFHGYNDRNAPWAQRHTLTYSLTEQILPYFGTLPGGDKNSKIVALPKGYGAYQQIMLDATSLNAVGVGNFYVTTEMELRSALTGFKRWSQFLIEYDNVYMESTEANDVEEGAALQALLPDEDSAGAVVHHPRISNNYAVTVPRSLWPNDGSNLGCNPNYGYPLYFGRATAIGLPSSSAIGIGQAAIDAITLEGEKAEAFIENIDAQIEEISSKETPLSQASKDLINLLKRAKTDGLRNFKLANQNRRNRLAAVIKVQQNLQKSGLSNAKKVFDFVKGIAEECLGKKFLVRIPNEVNLSYDKTVVKDANGVPTQGPFGFPPRNITNTGGYVRPALFDAITGNTSNYIGGLESNYNPITQQYDFNYLPEPQGGYYEYDLLDNLSPEGKTINVSQGISPQDVTMMDLGNSRISAYVRFDNAQGLLFNSFSKENVTVQTNQAGYMMPDLTYTLDNLSDGRQHAAPVLETPAPQIAFVKATLDSEFYMAPMLEDFTTAVYGREVDFNWTLSPPKQIFNPETCAYEDAIGYSYAQPTPKQTGSSSCTFPHYKAVKEFGITKMFPNPNYVYCLITLPNRVTPSIDSKLRDGPLQQNNTVLIKHFLGADVVRGVCGFDKPAIRGTPTNLQFEYLTPPLGEGFYQALTKANEAASFTEAGKKFTIGSPVYPDMVAIPLLSRDRCYGPWNNTNGGGKVEYQKDENLAPWNYNGFDNMNTAGEIQTGLTTGALLKSERGAFTVAGAPLGGIFLGKAISSDGPLLSNVSISVGVGGITTDYQLSLYTPKFGKINKQRAGNISRISRQQQKLEDDRNALIKKGFGKGQSGMISINSLYNNLGNIIRGVGEPVGLDAPPPPRYSVIEVKPQLDNYRAGQFANNGADLSNAGNVELKSGMLSDDNLNDAVETFEGNIIHMNQVGYNSAANEIDQGKVPVSLEPGHPNMSSQEMPSQVASHFLYQQQDGIKADDIATWNQPRSRGGDHGSV